MSGSLLKDKEHSNENLDFWLEAEKYRNSNEREPIAKFIIENFIQVRLGNFQSLHIGSNLSPIFIIFWLGLGPKMSPT